MTDLEITKLCAEAMGTRLAYDQELPVHDGWKEYRPLRDDAQAMALLKKFGLSVYRVHWPDEAAWYAEERQSGATGKGKSANRAICECVAKMQQAKDAHKAATA